MNEQLLSLYKVSLPAIVSISARTNGVSWPLFLEVPAGYSSAPIKLMVVGQETHGWGKGSPDSAAMVVSLYRRFDLGRRYRATPFWQAAHHLYRLLNPGGPKRTFLWSNLVKVDQEQA